MASPRQVTTVLVLAAAALVVGFGVAVLGHRTPTRSAGPTIAPDDPMRGADRPTVTVVEFGDFQCQFCRDGSEAVRVALAQTTVPVRHVWKDAPLPEHVQARPAAIAARCALRQGKFWEYHDRLFARQSELGENLFASLAAELELDAVAFGACQADPAVAERVRRDQAEAERLRVSDRPTLFINNRRVTGALTATSLRAIIQAEAAAGKPP